MKSHLLATAVCLALGSIGYAQDAEPADGTESPETLADVSFLTSPGEGWKLSFSDEFNGNTIDSSKWDIGLPWGGTDGTGRQHNDKYASYIMDHNHVVENGRLKLLTRKEDVTAKNGKVYHYTQGMLTTNKHFRQKYGYWEVRVKLPVEAGPGLWPAFWTLADGWPPEMDICEIWTGNNRSHQGLAYRPAEGGRERWDDENTHTPLPTGWTTYGMEWGPGYQIYNINGRITKRVYGEHVTDEAHYILLNSGVASDIRPSSATIFPNAFEVDYVRVYKRPDVPIVHNGDFELDALRPWGRHGHVVAVAYDARHGRHALRVDGGPSTSEQKIFGLKPSTAYILTGWVKRLTEAGEPRLGVKGYGGDETFAAAPTGTAEYQRLQVRFSTGPGATTAVIYCYMPTETGAALFDDISIEPATPTAAR